MENVNISLKLTNYVVKVKTLSQENVNNVKQDLFYQMKNVSANPSLAACNKTLILEIVQHAPKDTYFKMDLAEKALIIVLLI